MGSNEQEFLNQTFAADAKTDDDTTHTPNDKYGIVNVNCEHDNNVIPLVNVDSNKNREYENLSEMAKSANLKRAVGGLRGKKNKVHVAKDEQACSSDVNSVTKKRTTYI